MSPLRWRVAEFGPILEIQLVVDAAAALFVLVVATVLAIERRQRPRDVHEGRRRGGAGGVCDRESRTNATKLGPMGGPIRVDLAARRQELAPTPAVGGTRLGPIHGPIQRAREGSCEKSVPKFEARAASTRMPLVCERPQRDSNGLKTARNRTRSRHLRRRRADRDHRRIASLR